MTICGRNIKLAFFKFPKSYKFFQAVKFWKKHLNNCEFDFNLTRRKKYTICATVWK